MLNGLHGLRCGGNGSPLAHRKGQKLHFETWHVHIALHHAASVSGRCFYHCLKVRLLMQVHVRPCRRLRLLRLHLQVLLRPCRLSLMLRPCLLLRLLRLNPLMRLIVIGLMSLALIVSLMSPRLAFEEVAVEVDETYQNQ